MASSLNPADSHLFAAAPAAVCYERISFSPGSYWPGSAVIPSAARPWSLEQSLARVSWICARSSADSPCSTRQSPRQHVSAPARCCGGFDHEQWSVRWVSFARPDQQLHDAAGIGRKTPASFILAPRPCLRSRSRPGTRARGRGREGGKAVDRFDGQVAHSAGVGCSAANPLRDWLDHSTTRGWPAELRTPYRAAPAAP